MNLKTLPLMKRWTCTECKKLTRKLVHGTCAECAEKRAEAELIAQMHRVSEGTRALIQLARGAAAISIMLHELTHDADLQRRMRVTYPPGSPQSERMIGDMVGNPNPERFWHDTKILLREPPTAAPAPLAPVAVVPTGLAPATEPITEADPEAQPPAAAPVA